MEKKVPDPRFSQFTEQLSQDGKAIGFSIPNCDFIFKYDSQGGWYDEQKCYYNAEGILQSDDEEDNEDQESDNEDLSDSDDDQLVDQFEDMLRKEEEGYVKKETKQEKKVESQENFSKTFKIDKQLELKDFQALLDRYLKRQQLKENLSNELFIYFKQRAKYFELIKPQVQRYQSVDEKNKHIQTKTKEINQKRQSIISINKWLGEPQVFLDFSGESQVQNEYDRYWYGYIKTSSERYIYFLEQIFKSQVFYLLENKTYYALKSKIYHRKSEEQIKKTIKEFAEKIEALTDKQSIVIRIDNLPKYFPLSYVYDLVQYVGGNLSQIEDNLVIGEQAAQLIVQKNTALKIINLEAYNHDKGQYLEVSLKDIKDRVVENPEKRFYSISIQGAFKIHERQLNDTLVLGYSRSQLAKVTTFDVQNKSQIRFVLGSIPALKRVLMFRGQSLNVIHIRSQLPPQKVQK